MTGNWRKAAAMGAWAAGELQRRPPARSTPSREAGGGSNQPVTFIRCTSSTADADDNYPGIVTVRDNETGDWTDFGECVVRDPNDAVLTNDTVYGCRLAGANGDGVPLFLVVGAGAGGGTVVTDLTVTNFDDVTVTDVHQIVVSAFYGISITDLGGGTVSMDGIAANRDNVWTTTVNNQNGMVFNGDQDFPQGCKTVERLGVGVLAFAMGSGGSLEDFDYVLIPGRNGGGQRGQIVKADFPCDDEAGCRFMTDDGLGIVGVPYTLTGNFGFAVYDGGAPGAATVLNRFHGRADGFNILSGDYMVAGVPISGAGSALAASIFGG